MSIQVPQLLTKDTRIININNWSYDILSDTEFNFANRINNTTNSQAVSALEVIYG